MLKRVALLLVVAFVLGAPAWAQAPAAPAKRAVATQATQPAKPTAPSKVRASAEPTAALAGNPLLEPWTTPFQVPPYDKIKTEHFLPAFKAAIEQNRKEIDAIINNPQPPTFANTIEALEYSGELLSKVQGGVRRPAVGRHDAGAAGASTAK